MWYLSTKHVKAQLSLLHTHLSKEPHAYQNTNLLLRVLQFKLTCEDANHYFSSVKAHEKQQIVSV